MLLGFVYISQIVLRRLLVGEVDITEDVRDFCVSEAEGGSCEGVGHRRVLLVVVPLQKECVKLHHTCSIIFLRVEICHPLLRQK